MARVSDRLVWIDCEMTGLDLATDALIEVAVVVTDGDLVALEPGLDLVIKPPAEALAIMGEFVRTMHASSGLLPALATGYSLAEAEGRLLDYVTDLVPEKGRAPMAGNSIGTDRAFLARDMPTLESYVHYRNVDVSSVKELGRRWYPKVYYNAPEKSGNHRALADISESIEELRYYRETIFVPLPGPDSITAREIASRRAASSGTPSAAVSTPQSTPAGANEFRPPSASR